MRARYNLISIDGNENIEKVYQQIQSQIDDFLISENKETVIR